MRKFFVCALIALGTVCSYAQQYVDVDRVVIEIPTSYINKQASLKDYFVTIFGVEYTVNIQNVRLSPNWFAADILAIKSTGGTWSTDEWTIEQSCKLEDKTPDAHGYKSDCTTNLYQNYDFCINSIMHLLKPDGYGNIEIEYTIRDNTDPNAKFTLVLSIPYQEDTITTISNVQVEEQPVEYYDLQGNRLAAPYRGIIIKKQGNKTTKMLYR